MSNKLSKYLIIIGLSMVVIANLVGCSATSKVIKHGKLEVETKMSDTIFLDPIEEGKKIVFLQVRNTTDKEGLDIESNLKNAIQSKGYIVTGNPKESNIMIQVNILQAGKSAHQDPFNSLRGGYGGTLEGVLGGAMLGGAFSGSGRDMIGLGLLGGVAGTIMDAAVEVVQYSMITDLQISERADGEFVTETSDASLKQGSSGYKKSSLESKTNWKKYQTRIISVAKKVNLKFEDAQSNLTGGLTKSIAGIL
jgi:hypothetical protein